MIITSTLSNFLSNLKNHYISKKTILKERKTKQIIQLLNLLTNEGLINGFYYDIDNYIIVLLKYSNDKSVINHIKQISKPGKRVYVKNRWIYKNTKTGIYILSTQKGFLTQDQAKKHNLGGELICKIN
jgi:small subunit ribosomal protein S8